ncbi:UNVERIFIED_CONTAM: hypothetical protein GTU68_000439 [Idotea baltica]|nr:hypothetical protein [Idotea baltica]
MVVVDDEALAQRCRDLRNLCHMPGRRFVHEEIGWNYRMTNMQGALGLAQFEQIDTFIEKKRWIGNRYNELLKDLPFMQLPLASTDYATNIYWVYGMMVDENSPYTAPQIQKALGERKIGTRTFFYPMHQQPVFTNQGLYKGESYPVAEKMYRQGFYIPSGLGLEEEDIQIVADALKEIVK